jgi:N-dimethylarginine dimethylaminohydrolase
MAGMILMTDPEFYEVSYTINPWMRPEEWNKDISSAQALARQQWSKLKTCLQEADIDVITMPGVAHLPDLVFPANAAIVLDGKALLARFRYPERRGEEECFLRFFNDLKDKGMLQSVTQFPEGLFQEGAGDCIWDASRSLFWAGWGPRSDRRAMDQVVGHFGKKVVGLELTSDKYYHLDTCFSVLSGGEILYYPEALSWESRIVLEEIVPESQRIIATSEEAAAFSVNAVNIQRKLYLSTPPDSLVAKLREKDYECVPMDLSMFVISGGGAFCLTLRLDRASI